MQIPNWLNYDVKPYFNNPIFVGVLTLVVILYGSYAQQPLPPFVEKLFKTPTFLMLIFFAIVMIGTQDFRAAFILALVAASLMHYYNQRLITEAFMEGLRQEGFQVPFDPMEGPLEANNIPLDFNGNPMDENMVQLPVDPNQILDDPFMDPNQMDPSHMNNNPMETNSMNVAPMETNQIDPNEMDSSQIDSYQNY
jgi:hypothetical protein